MVTVHMTSSRDSVRQTRTRILEQAEQVIDKFLVNEHDRWSALGANAAIPVDAIADLIRAGGKRIRPAFCVSGYLAAGGEPEDPAIISAAIALEMLHTCALIHDDVMDASVRRRGAPTVHAEHASVHRDNHWQGESRRYGESVAILAGDLALIYADDFMAAAAPTVNRAWGELRAELIIGQHLDVIAAAEFACDPELSRQIAVVKSGHYTIHRPLVIGAIIAGRPELATAFRTYGVAIGEAFQLRDDLLDIFSDTETTGKPAGLDVEQHKMTLLVSLAMQRDPAVRELVTSPSASSARLGELLLDSGIRDEVETHIAQLVEKGCTAISDLPLEPNWSDELVDMAHAVVYRNK